MASGLPAGSGLDTARELAEAAKTAYTGTKHACERTVVRWEWGTFVLHSLDPAYFELHKVRRGAPLASEPDPPVSGARGYGFDESGRLVVERQLTEFPGRYHETFYRWESDGTARVNYGDHPKKPLINAAWLSRDGAGRVGSIATVYARGNTLAETFTYDDQGRVIGAERRGTNPPHGDLHDFRDLEYDAAGRIVRVFWRYPDGRRVLDFERPSDSQTFAALRKVLSDGLVRAIAAALGRLAIEHPVFALGIGFCGAEYQHRLPPNVAVGLDAERLRMRDAHGPDAPGLIWNPAEWRTHLVLDLDGDLSLQCESASQDIWQNDLQEEADVFLAHLARALGTAQLPIRRTEDFVAYAVDLDKGAFADEVASQIHPEHARGLRQRGLL